MISKDFLFNDWISKIKGDLGKTEWVTVYAQEEVLDNIDQGGIYCALVPIKKFKKALSNYQWDIRLGSGYPGVNSVIHKGKNVSKYARMWLDGFEPLIILRHFPDKKSYLELSEEFRLYFDLFEYKIDNLTTEFISFDGNGDEEIVARIKTHEIQIKLKFLKEYLAVQKMYLAIYFDFMRFSEKSINALGLKETNSVIKTKNSIYSLCIRPLSMFNFVSQSWLMGKKFIAPGLGDYSDKPLNNNVNKYEEFIIGLDDNGSSLYFTCDEEKLANFFGKNKGAPYYLTPVFFKKEVLSKYYNNPELYSVEDGIVHRNGFWGLRIDNNHPEYIIAYLGDLGKLAHKEQLYWKSYNITAQSGISRVAWERNFEGKFADPEFPDLFFKNKFTEFQTAWHRKFGWYLFKPLSEPDRHNLSSLHIPLTNNQKEFDEQVLSITKILIDSLNEKEIGRELIGKIDGAKSIDKLQLFMESKKISQPKMIEFLRNLQNLRSLSVAHRKSENKSDYKKVKAYFGIEDNNLIKVFTNIIIRCIWTLNSLDKYTLKE